MGKDMMNYPEEDRKIIARSQSHMLLGKLAAYYRPSLEEDPRGYKLIELLIERIEKDTRLDDKERLSSYRPTKLVIKGAESAQTVYRNIYPQIEELLT